MDTEVKQRSRAHERGAHHGKGPAGHPPTDRSSSPQQVARWRREFQALTGVDPRDGAAVKAWQAAHGLPPTGTIRRATLEAARGKGRGAPRAGRDQGDWSGVGQHGLDQAPGSGSGSGDGSGSGRVRIRGLDDFEHEGSELHGLDETTVDLGDEGEEGALPDIPLRGLDDAPKGKHRRHGKPPP